MKKLSKNNGFTLVEMLIVVAIIAILIAVSIPLVGSSLEKARVQTDNANLRAAKAEGAIIYLDPDFTTTYQPDEGTGTTYTLNYDADNGTLDQKDHSGYGQCKKHATTDYIEVVIDTKAGTVEAKWKSDGTASCT